MSALGDVLELMHGARSSYATLRLRAREWRHLARGEAAFARWNEARPGQGGQLVSVAFTSDGEPAGPPPETQESEIALWLAPGRARSESIRDGERHLTVIDGDRWWMHMPGIGSITNDGDPEHAAGAGDEVRALLDPVRLIPAVDLEVIGPGEAAGRSGLRVLARPRPERPGELGMWFLPQGADEHELLVDAERGVLLRLESRIDGEPFAITEILEVAFDEDLPDERFMFRAPDGLPARPAGEAFPRHEPITLHEAARRAPFAVFVPTLVPEGTELHVGYTAPGGAMGPGGSLHLSYAHHAYHLSVVQSPVADPADWGDEGWIDHDRDGRRIRLREMQGHHHALVELEGTRIFITAIGIEEPSLIDVAASLVRASPDPPRMVPAT